MLNMYSDEVRDRLVEEFNKTGGEAAGGVTVLDYFAAEALPSAIQLCATKSYGSREERISDAVSLSYKFAQAMLEERERILTPKKTPTVEEAFGLGVGVGSDDQA